MSKPYRTMEDYRALRVEAQRLVRAGVGINETGRRLEVAQGTIVRWASEDGFRLKDLEAERLTGKRAPPPAFLERAKYRRSGEMQWPAEYAARMAVAAEQQAEASREHLAWLSKPGGPLAMELDPEAAATRALVDADTLRGEGMFVTAERSARIAERLLRAGERLGLMAGGEAAAEPVQETWPKDLSSPDEARAMAARKEAFGLQGLLVRRITELRIGMAWRQEVEEARAAGRQPDFERAVREARPVRAEEEKEMDGVRRQCVAAGEAVLQAYGRACSEGAGQEPLA